MRWKESCSEKRFWQKDMMYQVWAGFNPSPICHQASVLAFFAWRICQFVSQQGRTQLLKLFSKFVRKIALNWASKPFCLSHLQKLATLLKEKQPCSWKQLLKREQFPVEKCSVNVFDSKTTRGQFLKQLANGLASSRKQLRAVFLRRLWTLHKFSLVSAVAANGPLANQCLRNWLQFFS